MHQNHQNEQMTNEFLSEFAGEVSQVNSQVKPLRWSLLGEFVQVNSQWNSSQVKYMWNVKEMLK